MQMANRIYQHLIYIYGYTTKQTETSSCTRLQKRQRDYVYNNIDLNKGEVLVFKAI